MMEELSTIEQMSKYAPHIYQDWNCVVCGNTPETFDHIWACSDNRSLLSIIRDDTKSLLTNLLVSMIDNNQHITYDVNLITDLWSTTNSEIFLNFIDFIKGFIPLRLSQWLTQFNLKQNDITKIINEL